MSETAVLKLETEKTDSRISTITKARKALEDAGIEFLFRADGALGVMLRPHKEP